MWLVVEILRRPIFSSSDSWSTMNVEIIHASKKAREFGKENSSIFIYQKPMNTTTKELSYLCATLTLPLKLGID